MIAKAINPMNPPMTKIANIVQVPIRRLRRFRRGRVSGDVDSGGFGEISAGSKVESFARPTTNWVSASEGVITAAGVV
jgi:hypothetical protein